MPVKSAQVKFNSIENSGLIFIMDGKINQDQIIEECASGARSIPCPISDSCTLFQRTLLLLYKVCPGAMLHQNYLWPHSIDVLTDSSFQIKNAYRPYHTDMSRPAPVCSDLCLFSLTEVAGEKRTGHTHNSLFPSQSHVQY